MTDTPHPGGRPGEDTRAKHPNLREPWQPGQSGNPNGRPLGARNKLGEAFVADLYDDWKDNGVAAIRAVRAEKPDAYLKVIASILPKDVNLNVNQFDNMSEDELIARIRALDAIVRPFLDNSAGSHPANGRGNGSAAAATVN